MASPSQHEGLPAGTLDRLIVQQYDPRSTVPIGGIDTCLRGVLEYARATSRQRS